MQQSLHTKLKELRRANNLTQEELATALGVSRQSISQWERGISYPDLDNLVLLCKIYNITINQLIESNDNVSSNNIQQQTIVPEHSKLFSMEFLCLAVLLTLFSQFPFLGIFFPILLIIHHRKLNQKNILLLILCIFCFIFSFYNTYAMISHIYFDAGTATITPVP